MSEVSSLGAVDATAAILSALSYLAAPLGVVRTYPPPASTTELYRGIFVVGNPNGGLLLIRCLGTTPELRRPAQYRSQRRNNHKLRIDAWWDKAEDVSETTFLLSITNAITVALNSDFYVKLGLGVPGSGIEMGEWNLTIPENPRDEAEAGSHNLHAWWLGNVFNAATDNANPS
jgi:hypothetical protein